jgi:hypothetical protein
MISRLVWMNLDTQDTCNIKQIPSPDWHTRYMQHKTSSIPSSIWHTHIYNCTIISSECYHHKSEFHPNINWVRLFTKTPLEEALNQSPGLLVQQVVASDGLLLTCKQISLVLLVLIILKNSTLILLLVPFKNFPNGWQVWSRYVPDIEKLI